MIDSTDLLTFYSIISYLFSLFYYNFIFLYQMIYIAASKITLTYADHMLISAAVRKNKEV